MKAAEFAMWLIYPKRCAVCNKVIDRNLLICDNCNEQLERAEKLCIKCGALKEVCRCRYNIYRFNACVAPFKNGEYSMRAVYNFKFKNNGDNAELLSRNMVNSIRKYFDGISFDAVTAVPKRRIEKFKKGYNQSELIAKNIADALGIKHINLLEKCKSNKVQHLLKRAERFGNVRGVYAAKNTAGIRTVLLVDDIITTGATLNECSRALLKSGVKNIYCVTAVTNSGKKKIGEESEN